MDNRIRVEANLESLKQDSKALQRIKKGMAKEGDQQLHTWLEDVKSSEQHLKEIEKEVSQMKRDLLADSLSVRLQLNSKVTECVKVVKGLKERAVEMFLSGVPGDKLKRFTSEDINSFTSDLSKQIGAGGFAVVYKGQFLENVQIAVKVLKQSHVTEEIFMVEVGTILNATHRNLVKLYGFCFDGCMKALIYEYMVNGSLDVVLLQKPCNLEWNILYALAVEIAKALAYLHHECDGVIIHHDIKPSNILLDAKFCPRVTDFGTARIMNSDMSHFTMTSIRGTPGYTAPEMFTLESRATYKCDVYSFGKMLLDVLGINKNKHEDVWCKLEKGGLDESLKQCGIMGEDTKKARILSLVAYWCIQFSPDLRPSMNDVVTVLEEQIQVGKPPNNPFYPCKEKYSMQQSKDVIYSTESPSPDESTPDSASQSKQKKKIEKGGMENGSRLEENLKKLSAMMDILEKLKDKVERIKPQQMEAWLEEVGRIRNEFEELGKEISRLVKGGSLQEKVDLNRKLIRIYKSVYAQTEVAKAIPETIKTLLQDLPEEKPQKFTHADLHRFTSGFTTVIDALGNGTVCKGKFPSGVEIVVKVLVEDEDTVEKTFIAEMITMFRTSHKNLVKLYGYCFEENMKALVFEYTTNGSLDKYLYENRIDIEWEKLYDIAVDTAKGLSYLHNGCEKQIIHHDVKASNVLLAANHSELTPKITNFGMMKMMDREKTHVTLTKIRGGPSCAPEMMQSLHLTCKYDVYTFGMMLLEILGRRRIVPGRVYFPNVVWDMFEKKEYGKITQECGHSEENREKGMILCMVAFWCIQYTPKRRPTMDIVVKMLEKKIKVNVPPNFRIPQANKKSFEDVVYDFKFSVP